MPEFEKSRVRAGKDAENDALFLRVYGELRRIAKRLNGAAQNTLTPTGLVNEAWLRIAESPEFRVEDADHMVHSGTLAMRQILVDRNRRRRAVKRGGEAERFVTFHEGLGIGHSEPWFRIAFDRAMEELQRQCPRQAAVAMLRLVEQLEEAEIARRLGISPRTVARDWTFVKAWLSCRLLAGPARARAER